MHIYHVTHVIDQSRILLQLQLDGEGEDETQTQEAAPYLA